MQAVSEFPPAFLWGAATSAYQIEGSPLADGAGASIWHRFSHTPHRVHGGNNGDVACDHYRRFLEDVQLMRSLGLQAYRFSVAWGRVMPEGRGQINQRGLGFYDRLVDALLECGIEPFVTLYHWDLPAALDDLGGWLHPDSAKWFADYAVAIFRALDGRVRRWTTLNEPWVIADGGYLHGTLAPGHRSLREAPVVSHNLLRAHGMAIQAYRGMGRHEIGLVVNIEPKYPATGSAEDKDASIRADAYMNRQYLDPVYLGRYPEQLREVFGDTWPPHPDSDFDLIRQPIDFLGVNYYTRSVVRADPSIRPLRARGEPQIGALHTETGWEVYPQGLTDTLVWIADRYGNPPTYVCENGAAFADPDHCAGQRVDDPLRLEYLRRHLLALRAAVARGADVRGYFVWSLLDNFEWALGYSKRFGIVHVDYETQRRTRKTSADFYARVVETNGASLDEPAERVSAHVASPE